MGGGGICIFQTLNFLLLCIPWSVKFPHYFYPEEINKSSYLGEVCKSSPFFGTYFRLDLLRFSRFLALLVDFCRDASSRLVAASGGCRRVGLSRRLPGNQFRPMYLPDQVIFLGRRSIRVRPQRRTFRRASTFQHSVGVGPVWDPIAAVGSSRRTRDGGYLGGRVPRETWLRQHGTRVQRTDLSEDCQQDHL